MQSKVFISLIVALSFLLTTAPGYAQLAADFMNYQGQLKSSGGDPVPDDNYSLVFTVWDHPVDGAMVWSEEQSVETSDGSFQVNLGSVNPLDQDVFGGPSNPASRWLQMQVVGDNPMTPRIELGVTPFAFISTRLYGDVVTEPGKLTVSDGAAVALVDSKGDPVAVNLTLETDGNTLVDLGATATGGSARFKGISTLNPEIKLNADDLGASLDLLLNEDAGAVYSASQWGAGSGSAWFELADPRPSPDFIITTDATGSKIEMGDIEGGRLIENVVLSIAGDDTGGNVSLLGGSPLTPSVIIIADQTGATIDLTCDSDEQPKVEIATDCTGANIAFSFGGDVGLQPSVDMGINDISSYLSLLVGSEQQPVVDFLADAEGGSIELSQTNSQARISVSSSGINIYEPEGALMAVFEPNGVVAPKGNFGSSNTNAGTNTLVVGSSNSAGGNFSSVLGGSGNSAGGGSAVVCGG
ncbi:MAG: hypothetical protein V3W18_08980, partial [candidate division Zixibacteria bacterium]